MSMHPLKPASVSLQLSLESYLQERIPGSRLEKTVLPLVPEISLYLINADYPRGSLNPDQIKALMDDPPYWGFCWASGHVLARYLLNNPHLVQGKTLVDFGAGSGVVGIAAKMAGAKRVVLCDKDPKALEVCRLNAELNGVETEFSASLEDILNTEISSMVTVADVFYDRENLPLLRLLQARFAQVLVADSRLKNQPLSGMEILSSLASHTVPDLDESVEFNTVTLYHCPRDNSKNR